MHLNSCFMIGRVRAKGPQLRYAENGTPLYSFLLEIDELTNGRTYTTYIPCEITGKYAEQTAVGVKPGDVLQLAGKWKYKSTVDPKSGVKVSKPVVSSWGISQRQAAVPELPQEEISAVDGVGGWGIRPASRSCNLEALAKSCPRKRGGRATQSHYGNPGSRARINARA